MHIEVTSVNPNATNQILMGLKRRDIIRAKGDELFNLVLDCEEVAKELGYDFEYKENGDLSFKDKQ